MDIALKLLSVVSQASMRSLGDYACSIVVVSHNQTAFFFYIGTGKKSSTLNSKFLFRLPPKPGWVMIGDDYNFLW